MLRALRSLQYCNSAGSMRHVPWGQRAPDKRPDLSRPLQPVRRPMRWNMAAWGGNEVLQQVLQRAILAEQKASLLEASLKDMTAQRDKWVLQADYWKEQAQHVLPSPARHTF